jgi:hypothetical protein
VTQSVSGGAFPRGAWERENIFAKEVFSMRVKFIVLAIMFVSLLCINPYAMAQEKRIETQCGEYKIAITCGHTTTYPEDPRYCNKNTLTFTWPNGKVITPKVPKGFDDSKTPMGFWCGLSKDGRFFVKVEFSNGSQGCGPCTTIDLFEANGKRVTVNMRYSNKTVGDFRLKSLKEYRIEWDDKIYRKLHEEGKI